MLQFCRIILSVLVFVCLATPHIHAGQEDIQQDFSAALERMLQAAGGLQESPGHFYAGQFSSAVEEYRASCLLLREQLRNRELRLQQGNDVALARHRQFSLRVHGQLQGIDSLIEKVLDQPDPARADLVDLQHFLQKLIGNKPPVIHGTSPYRHLKMPAISPQALPEIVPVYQTTSTAHTAGDLKGVPEAPLSQTIYQQAIAIAEAAGKQNWDPVDLYQWVKNNIQTEWYWGSMKGAEETLLQGCGNDADQAALLIALLRASGYPARYVRGVVEFFPDIEAARQLYGVEDLLQIGELLRNAGIPHQPVMNGLEVVNYRLEHVWVEALIPYANYRGAMADAEGKLWLPLDTSFKISGYDEFGGLDLYTQPENPLPGLRDLYLSETRSQAPLDYLHDSVDDYLVSNVPVLQYNSLLHRRQQKPEYMQILSTAPQFTEVAITGEYTALPEELIHTVQLLAVKQESGEVAFDLTLPVRALTGREVQISYEPETIADQETINLWGGLDNTPSYLVRLRPVLLVNKERIAVGQFGFAAGDNVSLQVLMQSPSTSVDVENQVVVGYPTIIGLVAQEVDATRLQQEGGALERLHRIALDYIDSWNRNEQEIAELFNLSVARPLATLVTLGGVMKVEELFGEPQNLSWRGLYIDADHRTVSVVPRSIVDNRSLPFMQLSALQGAALEHEIFERHFGVESISTVKLFSLAHSMGIPILQVDSGNVDALLPGLDLEEVVEADIVAAVNDGLVVRIPREPINYYAWSGTGYIKEDPVSGETGYMLSGQIAGGSTVLGKLFWGEADSLAMERPFLGEPNQDVTAAHSVVALTPLQVRLATAGEELTAPLMVKVRDEAGVPVAHAPVVLNVAKGAGWLLDDSVVPVQTAQSLTVLSGYDGIARARFVPGESVFSNPIVITRPGDEQANIAGENLIEAQLGSGSLQRLESPIVVLGFAGLPDITQVQLVGDGRTGDVLSFAGDAGIVLNDRFANPVANYSVQFTTQSPQLNQESSCPEELAQTAATAEIVAASDPCLGQLPVHGECSSATETLTLTSRSDGSAVVGVILGGVAGADYAIETAFQTDGGMASHFLLHQYAADDGACGSAPSPLEKLVLSYPRLQDQEGRNLDARLAGKQASFSVKSYLITEGAFAQVDGEPLMCTPEPDLLCDRIVGNGDFAIQPPDQVAGNGHPMERVAVIPDSTAMPYLYGLETTLVEGLNQIPLSATAVHTRASISNDCSGCGSKIDAERTVGPAEETVEVWGISLQLPDALIVPVDDLGRLQKDTEFEYTIHPAEYVAGMAQILIYADGNLIEILLAGTSGSTQVTIPVGYTFNQHKTYEIQLLLGNPGDVNAIYSDRIPVMPTVSQVDLHIDGLPEVMEDQVGAFVLLNNDFDERDADAAVTLPDVATASMIAEDDELKRAWVHIDDADMVGGTWQVTVDDPTKIRIFFEQGGEFFEMKSDDLPQLITESPLTVQIYLEGLAESSGLHANSLNLRYVSSAGLQTIDALPLTVVHLDMAVDGNRDRELLFNAKADESALFWVNNDKDEKKYSYEDDQEVEDDAEEGDDSLDNRISCKRDLEDFARLHIELGNAVSDGILNFKMEMIAEDPDIQPMLNIFPGQTLFEEYLGFGTNLFVADQQLLFESVAAVGSEPSTLKAGLIATGKTNAFLYEGRNNGSGSLVLKANYEGVPVIEKSIDLSLYDISYFYDHFIVEESGIENHPVNEEVNLQGVSERASRVALYQPTTDEYVMFVHGWNVEPWLKRRWAETIFKRLWWRGYQGKVGLFDWPCRTLPSWDLPVNFDTSEFLAWHSGSALRTLIEDLNDTYPGQIRVLAHSQGNVVAGEALREIEPGIVHSYVASQAALSASFYESDLEAIQPPLTPFTIETPEVYGAYPVAPDYLPILSHVSDRIGTLIAYFNVDDYALTGDDTFSPRWEANNKMKPDDTLMYGYDGSPEGYPPVPPDLGFYQTRVKNTDGLSGSIRYQLTFPLDSHEIYSFGAESRTRALGAVESLPVFMPTTEILETKGSRDLSLIGYDSEHYSHSKEFRSSIVEEQKYWERFILDSEINNDLSALRDQL